MGERRPALLPPPAGSGGTAADRRGRRPPPGGRPGLSARRGVVRRPPPLGMRACPPADVVPRGRRARWVWCGLRAAPAAPRRVPPTRARACARRGGGRGFGGGKGGGGRGMSWQREEGEEGVGRWCCRRCGLYTTVPGGRGREGGGVRGGEALRGRRAGPHPRPPPPHRPSVHPCSLLFSVLRPPSLTAGGWESECTSGGGWKVVRGEVGRCGIWEWVVWHLWGGRIGVLGGGRCVVFGTHLGLGGLVYLGVDATSRGGPWGWKRVVTREKPGGRRAAGGVGQHLARRHRWRRPTAARPPPLCRGWGGGRE